jgi:hypothetical protein
VTLILNFDLDLENFNLIYIFWSNCELCYGFDTWDVDAFWRDLSFSTQMFDLVTLILNFDLILKNFNLGYIFWSKWDGTLLLKI